MLWRLEVRVLVIKIAIKCLRNSPILHVKWSFMYLIWTGWYALFRTAAACGRRQRPKMELSALSKRLASLALATWTFLRHLPLIHIHDYPAYEFGY